jgi:hypothetical protein
MDSASCDLCGGDLLGRDLRYIVEIKVYAAYDPLEITRSDFNRDLRGEMRDLLKKISTAEPESLEEEVYAEMKFDLCPTCRRKYMAEPLPGRPSPF